jgi:low temperature requirement protein LtrA
MTGRSIDESHRAASQLELLFDLTFVIAVAALAATGAGLEAAVAHSGHHAATPSVAVGYAVAVPVAVFLTLVWALHVPIIARPVLRPAVILGGAAAILLLSLASLYIPLAAVVATIATACALVVGTTVVLDQRGRRRGSPAPEPVLKVEVGAQLS